MTSTRKLDLNFKGRRETQNKTVQPSTGGVHNEEKKKERQETEKE